MGRTEAAQLDKKRSRQDDPLPSACEQLILTLRRLHQTEDLIVCKKLLGLDKDFAHVKANNLSQYLKAAESDEIIRFEEGRRKCRLRQIWKELPRKERRLETVRAPNDVFDIDLDALPVSSRALIRFLRDKGDGWISRDAAEGFVHIQRAAARHGFATTLGYLNKAEDNCIIEVDRSRPLRLVRLTRIWRRVEGDVFPVAYKFLILRMMELLGGRLDGWTGTHHLNEHGCLLPSFNLTQRTDILGYLTSAQFAGIVECHGPLVAESPIRFCRSWRDFLQKRDRHGRFVWSEMPAVEPFKALIDQICSLGGGQGQPLACAMIVKDASIRMSFALARVYKLRPYLQAAAEAGVIEIDEEEEEAKLRLRSEHQQEAAHCDPPESSVPPPGYAPLIQLLQVLTDGDGYVSQIGLFKALGSARDSLADKAGLAVRPGFDRFTAYLIQGTVLGVIERSESKGVRLAERWRKSTADTWLENLRVEMMQDQSC